MVWQGEERTLYTARRVLEQRKVFLVCDGISPQMVADLGFVYCTDSLADVLAVALALFVLGAVGLFGLGATFFLPGRPAKEPAAQPSTA